jgi:hypothetical protein
MFQECRHIKSDGQRCRSAALRGKPYCFFHMKFDRMQKRDTPHIPPLEDSTSILLAIGQVIRALNFETMDCKRAALMLYGLQIAATVARQREHAEPVESVRSVHNLAGEPLDFNQAFVFGADMLAPETSVCEPPHDCPNCPQHNSCDKPNAVIQRNPAGAPEPVIENQNLTGAEGRKHAVAYVQYLDEQNASPNNTPSPASSGELLTLHAEAHVAPKPRRRRMRTDFTKLLPGTHPSRTEIQKATTVKPSEQNQGEGLGRFSDRSPSGGRVRL